MIQVETTPYGADAHRALAAEIARLKGGDPLRPVSVVVSSNPMGIAARRALGHAGGIAAVTSKEDSVDMHVADTLAAGAGMCKEDVVRTIVEEGPERVGELMSLGMDFSEREVPGADGIREYDLGKEGGHSKRRILHAKDATGRAIDDDVAVCRANFGHT